VIERRVELSSDRPLRTAELGSAGFSVPTPHAVHLTYLSGQ
jgi:hypothetical protein